MIYKTDYYLCERFYPLDDVQKDVLVYLYLPLIGHEAYSLYLFLHTESKRMEKQGQPCGMNRLVMMMNMSIDHIQSAMYLLEGIGLLRTYCKNNGKVTYVLSLQSPLSLKSYFNNVVLMTLLKHTIGEEGIQLCREFFKVSIEDKSDYEEITQTFSQVYSVDLSEAKPLKDKSHYMNYNEGDFEVDYDLTLFYETLKDYTLPLNKIKPYEKLIKQIAVLYSIDVITLSMLVRDSYHGQFDVEAFKNKARNHYQVDTSSHLKEVYHTQPDVLKDVNGSSKLDHHLRYLESISPYQLLKNKQGGKEPVLHDLSIAETLMTQLGLTPGVTNVLLEFVLGKNNNQLSRSYCETIGASWSRKHIKSVKEAYQEAMNKPVEAVVEKKVKEKEEVKDIGNDELMAMIARIKGSDK